jgi:Zn-dependent protease with chaperone function
MGRGSGRSFVALVGIGLALELTGGTMGLFGIDTIARCYWAWFPGSGLPPSVCMRPISGAGFHLFVPAVALLALLCLTVCLGVFRAVRLACRVRRLSERLGPSFPELPEEVAAAARNAGASRVEVREHELAFGVCLGMFRPRVVVSTALVQLLDGEELVAVLAHEERHRSRRAPLRQVVARAIAKSLFFLPVLTVILDAHLVDEEIVADREALAVAGQQPLVRALAKLADKVDASEAVAQFGGISALLTRLRALEGGALDPLRVGPRRMAVSAVSLGTLVLLVLWMPIAGLH